MPFAAQLAEGIAKVDLFIGIDKSLLNNGLIDFSVTLSIAIPEKALLKLNKNEDLYSKGLCFVEADNQNRTQGFHRKKIKEDRYRFGRFTLKSGLTSFQNSRLNQ